MNWLKKAQQCSPAYFDDVTENIVGSFRDTVNGRLITRQTGKEGTVRYYVGDDGVPNMVYPNWRGADNKIEDEGCNVVCLNGRWYRVDLATGELGGEY